MKAIILHYPTRSVYVAEIPKECTDIDKIEEHLVYDLDLSLDDINYMTTDDYCPVYNAGDGMRDGKRIATL